MSESQETPQDADPFEETPLTPTRIGAMFGLMDVVVFAFVGYAVFENPLAGGVAGLFVGTGVFLFLPAFVTGSMSEDGRVDGESGSNRHPFRSFHRPAAGFALSAGGIAYFAYFFVEESLVPALPLGLLVAVAGYVALSFVLPAPEP